MIDLKTRPGGALFYESPEITHPEQTGTNYATYYINHPQFKEPPDEVIMYVDENENGTWVRTTDQQRIQSPAGTISYYYYRVTYASSTASQTVVQVFRVTPAGSRKIKFRMFKF